MSGRCYYRCKVANFLSLIIMFSAASSSLGLLLGLHLLANFVALVEDVIGQVVDGVCRANPVHINHTLSQDWNDLFHQELAHVKI